MRSAQHSGAAAARWNEADGWYGSCGGGPAFERRPPSFAHQVQARFARGVLVPAASFPRDGKAVAVTGTTATASSGWAPAPVVAPPSDFAVVLINRSGSPATVTLRANFADGAAPTATTAVGLHAVTAAGPSSTPTSWGGIAGGAAGAPVIEMDVNAVMVLEWNASSV